MYSVVHALAARPHPKSLAEDLGKGNQAAVWQGPGRPEAGLPVRKHLDPVGHADSQALPARGHAYPWRIVSAGE